MNKWNPTYEGNIDIRAQLDNGTMQCSCNTSSIKVESVSSLCDSFKQVLVESICNFGAIHIGYVPKDNQR